MTPIGLSTPYQTGSGYLITPVVGFVRHGFTLTANPGEVAEIFETLGVRMMCLTASLDNVRSQKGIDAAGFVRMGERDAVRPDGTIRRSVYWEMTRDEWRRRHRL